MKAHDPGLAEELRRLKERFKARKVVASEFVQAAHNAVGATLAIGEQRALVTITDGVKTPAAARGDDVLDGRAE